MAERVDIRVPEDQQEGTSATLAAWLNAVGDEVEKDEAVAELETDKVNMEVVSPVDGILLEILVEEGEAVKPGTLLARVAPNEGVEKEGPRPREGNALQPRPEKVAVQPSLDGASRDRFSPVVRRLLREHDLDATSVKGTGSGGRITREDVVDHVARSKRNTPSSAVNFPPIQVPFKTVPHDGMRRAIASHMVASLQLAPHVTAVFEMDLTAVGSHRRTHKQAFADRGVHLTYTAYFVVAATSALQAVPEVNSSFSEDALRVYSDCNIGVGTALDDKGLIVPVIHKAQDLDLFGIASRLQDLTQRARLSKLKPEDVQNGTFTISNHGVSGSLIATPIIINQPQSAILGIGKMEKRAVVVEEKGEEVMRIRPRAYVTLSIDHRALDAYHTNTFLTRLVEVIEFWPPE